MRIFHCAGRRCYNLNMPTSAAASSASGAPVVAGAPVSRARKNRARGWMFIALAIATEVTATLCLKGALEQPLLYAVVATGYIAAFTALAYALRAGLGLGVAYGVWGACGVAITAVASMALYGEPITPAMWAGIALVVTGVLCVELGSQRAHRADGLAAATIATGEFPAINLESATAPEPGSSQNSGVHHTPHDPAEGRP